MARILILTAGFGEGHNTAARCACEALQAMPGGNEVRVLDPLAEASPLLTAVTREAYLGIINHCPIVWRWIYEATDTFGGKSPIHGALRPAMRRVADELAGFRPDAVVTTYPLYLQFWAELFPAGSTPPCPLLTVVTDSITINAIWTRGRSTLWCATDPLTAGRLVDLGVPAGAVRVTGFPVSPKLASLRREMPAPGSGMPFRLLFFPIASRAHTRKMLAEMARLPATPAWTCTVVLGKNKDNLRPMIDDAIRRGTLPADTRTIGWTDQIPELLNSHHLVLGKAGGATVHEARTAARPMLVHYMVPGQEEGNARLLEAEGAGHLLAAPGDFKRRWEDLTRDGFAGWRTAHEALLGSAPPDPAHQLATLVLASLSPTP